MTPAAVQTLIVVLIIAGALLYLGRRFRRTLSAARARKQGDAACAGSCCEATPAVTRPTTPLTRAKTRS